MERGEEFGSDYSEGSSDYEESGSGSGDEGIVYVNIKYYISYFIYSHNYDCIQIYFFSLR